jgi:DNA-binding transcriptional LysR family regulator
MTDFRLKTFLEVYRQQGFTRAAETLHITQPAVTQHIKYLEEDLGRPLFVINGRTIELTGAGEILLRYAETVEADARRTRERIAATGGRKSLRFGATRTIGEYVMPQCVAGWTRDRPETDVSLVVDNSDSLFRALSSGDLDFIFVEGVFDRNAWSSDVLFRDAMIPVCAPENRLAGKRVDFARLLAETLIIREKGSGGRALVEMDLAARNLRVESFSRVLEIGNIGAIKELVMADAGIAILYERSVAREIAGKKLARIPVKNFSLAHDYSFVCMKGSLYENEYREFLEYCRRHCLARRLSPPLTDEKKAAPDNPERPQ